MEINKIIKKRRLELGLTLKDVANALGIAESTVSRYESSDIQNMGIDKIESLAKVLECSPAYLMGWEKANIVDLPNQLNLFDLPVCSIDNANILENELIKALRILQNTDKERYDNLYSIFLRIPSLPTDLQDDIFEYAYITIKKYDKAQLNKNLQRVDYKSSPILNAAHADIGVSDEDNKHDEDIMNDDKKWGV